MRDYVPDDAAMSHGDYDPADREQEQRRRIMNRMQERKDELIDLLATPLPAAEVRKLTAELTEAHRGAYRPQA